MNDDAIHVGLIRSRHEMPVEKFIHDRVGNVMNFDYLYRRSLDFIQDEVGICVTLEGKCINQIDDVPVKKFSGKHHLVVYITGLTPATGAIVKACARYGVHLTLMHFDIVRNTYKPQEIF